MHYLHGLVLAAFICLVKAESKADQIRNEIAETEKETIRIREEIDRLKNHTEEQRKHLDTMSKRIKRRNEDLTEEQNDLIDKMYSLNISLATIEFYVNQDQIKLQNTHDFGYRLAFIKKLLRQDLQLLVFRKNKGDEESCYEFDANKTEIDERLKHADNDDALSARSLSAQDRLLSILGQRVNAAKMDLAKAKNDHQLQEKLVATQDQYMNKLIEDSKGIEEQLIESVDDAKRIIKEFEENITEKKAVEKRLHEEYLEEIEKHKIEIDDILALKKRIGTFHKAHECYLKLERETLE